MRELSIDDPDLLGHAEWQRARIAQLEALLPFVHKAMERAISGDDETLMEFGLHEGVIELVPYDPTEHGESDLEPGEPWLVPSPETMAALSE